MSNHPMPDIGFSTRAARNIFRKGARNLPRFTAAKIMFPSPRIQDPEAYFIDALEEGHYRGLIKPGSNIAIAVGSRGIANIKSLLCTLVSAIRKSGGHPFIVPAMGSHGGATGQGQKLLLHGLGITEEAVGAPIHSSMAVVNLGKTAEGVPVYIDRLAFNSDGIILVNRVREHTDFDGPIQSGLMKMLSVGLGKARGASAIHSAGAAYMPVNIPSVAKIIIAKAPILFGVAIVENGNSEVAAIRCALPENFDSIDRELLELARRWTPRLPVDGLDVLIVRSIGKEISGTGMDTKTIGRIRIPGVPEPDRPLIHRIVALDLTSESQGNATGLALADIITQRLFSKIDFKAFYMNQLAASHFEGGKIPIVMATDRDAIETAMCLGWNVNPGQLRSMIIPDTKHISDLLISEALVPELKKLDHVYVEDNLLKLDFSAEGTLLN